MTKIFIPIDKTGLIIVSKYMILVVNLNENL